MRAHNQGDGGIMALAALLQRHKIAHRAALVTLGIFGAALFFGDGIITPSISVLGSLQGLKVAAPGLAHLVVPLSVVDPDRAVLSPAARIGRDRLAVRPGDLGLVSRHRANGSQPGRKGSGGAAGPVAHLGCAISDRQRRRRVSGTRRGGPRCDGRRGALCGPGPLRRRADPAGLVRSGAARAGAELPRPGRSSSSTTRARRGTPSTSWLPAGSSTRCSSWRPRRRSSPRRRQSRGRSRWRGRRSSLASFPAWRSATPPSLKARSTSRSSTGRCASASSR